MGSKRSDKMGQSPTGGNRLRIPQPEGGGQGIRLATVISAPSTPGPRHSGRGSEAPAGILWLFAIFGLHQPESENQTMQRKGKSMNWVLFAVGAALFWGVYGPSLHKGQVMLGNPLRALLCVGVAYFLVGVLVPLFMLRAQGSLNGFGAGGTTWATVAGALGAIGAVCIILAFKQGGLPAYVMPLVFAGAPVVNVLVSMVTHPPKQSPSPLLWVGFGLAASGAWLVLRFKPV